MTKIEIRIDDDFKAAVNKAALEKGLKLSDVVRCLLGWWLDIGAPDPTVPDERILPSMQDVGQLVESLGRAAFQIQKIAIYLQKNSDVGVLDALLKTMQIDSSSPDQAPSPDLPEERATNQKQ